MHHENPETPGIPPEALEAAAGRLRRARRAVALTGAGMSVESGIPPFRGGRGGGGLWDLYDPMEYGTLAAFLEEPEKAWKMLRELGGALAAARPHEGHRALARMEANGRLQGIITQNIDGLHQEAGSRRVLELHGGWRTMTCLACRARVASESVALRQLPPACGSCGGLLKPDVILFGEVIPHHLIDQAREAASSCDLLLIVGTSAEVVPAALLPGEARRHGAFLIEINPEETPLTRDLVDLRLAGAAGIVLPRLLEAIQREP